MQKFDLQLLGQSGDVQIDVFDPPLLESGLQLLPHLGELTLTLQVNSGYAGVFFELSSEEEIFPFEVQSDLSLPVQPSFQLCDLIFEGILHGAQPQDSDRDPGMTCLRGRIHSSLKDRSMAFCYLSSVSASGALSTLTKISEDSTSSSYFNTKFH